MKEAVRGGEGFTTVEFGELQLDTPDGLRMIQRSPRCLFPKKVIRASVAEAAGRGLDDEFERPAGGMHD